MSKTNMILQFRVSLQEILPPIWRRIQVPDSYSFWDLHVAIQDSMGWLDYHLHEFSFNDTKIGIPNDDNDYDTTEPDWRVPVTKYFKKPGDRAFYLYDFGDRWGHDVILEGVLLGDEGLNYPQCVGGERACPPEDCHGLFGYDRLLEILADRSHEEYGEMVEWLKNHAKNYYPFDSEHFEPSEVKFDDPDARWERAFSEHSA